MNSAFQLALLLEVNLGVVKNTEPVPDVGEPANRPVGPVATLYPLLVAPGSRS